MFPHKDKKRISSGNFLHWKSPGMTICVFNIVIRTWAFIIRQMQLKMHFCISPPTLQKLVRCASPSCCGTWGYCPLHVQVLIQILKIQLFITWREENTILTGELEGIISNSASTAHIPAARWVTVPCHGFSQVSLLKAPAPHTTFVEPPSTVLPQLVLNYWFSAWHHLWIYPGLSTEPLFKSAVSAQGVLGTSWVPHSPAVNSFAHLLLQHHMQSWSALHSDVRSLTADRAAEVEQLLVPQDLISELSYRWEELHAQQRLSCVSATEQGGFTQAY